MKDRLTTASLPMERPVGLFCIVRWQEILSPSSIRRSAPWNAQSATGTARRAILYCSLAGDIISGGERFSFRGPQRASLEWGEEE